MKKAYKSSYNKGKGKVAVDKNDRFKTSPAEKLERASRIAKNTADVVKLVPTIYSAYKAVKGMAHAASVIASFNDPKWYTHYPNLTDSGEGLQFTMPNGLVEARSEWAFAPDATTPWEVGRTHAIPSVAGVMLVLTLGDFTNRQNALNRIYNALRRVNTGSIPYTTLDLDAYIYGFRSILALHSLGRRAYGCITKNTIYNVNKPAEYFAAMGLDYDTFRSNSAQLRNELNLAADTMKVYAPYSLDVFKRTAWLFDNIFATSEGVKDQEYLFTLWHYMFIWSNNNQKGERTIVTADPSASQTGLEYSLYAANLYAAVARFTENPKNAVIAGDMAKAFGIDKVHVLPIVEENYEAPTIYDPAALLQISNAVLTGVSLNSSDTLLPNSDGTMLEETIAAASSTQATVWPPKVPYSMYINLPYDQITREDILEFSRFSCFMTDQGIPKHYGTEIVRGVIIPVYDPLNSNKYHLSLISTREYNAINMTPATFTGETISNRSEVITSFDFFPKYRLAFTWRDVNADTHDLWTSWIYNWSNWAQMSDKELQSINNVACSSLYYVPLLVKETKDVLAVD